MSNYALPDMQDQHKCVGLDYACTGNDPECAGVD